MRKFTLIAALAMAATSFVTNAQDYWYIRGPFNAYSPDGDAQWALSESSGSAGVFSGTFTIPPGEFEINFQNPDDNVFVPYISKSFTIMNQTVEFTDNVFSGESTLAWDDYDEVYMWKYPEWEGGTVTFTIFATTNNPKVEFTLVDGDSENPGDSEGSEGSGDDLSNAPTLTEILDEVEGRAQNYLRYGHGYFPYMGTIYEYFEDTEPSPSTIVYGTDNKTIYFKDIMDYGWETYTPATISGNKITLKLPQTLFEETYSWVDEPYYHNLCVLSQEGSGSDLTFTYDDTITEVTYTVNENGDITLDPLPEGKALGIMTYFIGKVYDNEGEEGEEGSEEGDNEGDEEGEGNQNYHLEWIEYWSGSADFTQKFSPIGVELIEMPEGVEPLTYYVVINGYNYPVDVAIDGDYMYIQGLGDSQYISNFVVRATIDGDTAYIPQNQYVGVYKMQNEMVITKCGYQKGYDIIYEDDDVNFEFTIDSERKLLQAADKDMYFCFAYMRQFDDTTGQNGLIDYYKNFYIIYQETFPGVPSNPYGLFVHDDFYEDYGYHSFGFEMKAFSTTGDILLTGNLYYSIYIDGELEVFEYDPEGEPYSHYFTLPEATSEIPFMFTNDNDLDIWSETERQVGIYYDGVTTYGVQAVYYYDDVRTVSDIVTLNVETGEVTITAGIEAPKVAGEVVKTEYYDLTGRKISHPDKGIFIVKQQLSNGEIKTRKVVR